MKSTCPHCLRALTIKEAILKTCGRCRSSPSSRPSQKGSNIKQDFDALISAELRKRRMSEAA